MSSPFHDDSNYLIIAYTSLNRKLIYDSDFYEWNGDEDNPALEDIETFGQKEWNIDFCDIARDIKEEWEGGVNEDDEDEDDSVTAKSGEIITKVTVFEIKLFNKENETTYDLSEAIGTRVAKALSYFRPFIVD